MSTGIDIEFIRENYQRMSNDELMKIATQDAFGLTPAALEVVKEEIRKRNLDTNVIKGLELQNRTLSIQEIDYYCSLLQKLDCPKCGGTSQNLNGTLTSEVISFVIVSQHHRKLKVACPICLDKLSNAALTKTLLFGWWGIPWGVVRTIQAIGHYAKAIKQHHVNAPNIYLKNFVLQNIGEIETYKDKTLQLQEIIATG